MRRPVIVATLLTILLAGCGSKPQDPSQFRYGDVVAMKMDGRKGTVVKITSCPIYGYDQCSYFYDVRFPNLTTSTDTHLIGADGNLRSSPYGTTQVFDYELTKSQVAK